jgi:hypothetical protein
VSVAAADEAIALAEQLISTYSSLYGELAVETATELQETQQILADMASTTAAVEQSLELINSSLSQGLTLAEDTISQLETSAQAANAQAEQAQAKVQTWSAKHQTELDNRAAAALGVKPNQIAGDRQGALLSAFDFLDTGRAALGDGKITTKELADISQLGANASASLNAQGGSQLQKLSGSVQEITTQFARGRTPQARQGLGGFENALGTRPQVPARPEPERPEPARPGRR